MSVIRESLGTFTPASREIVVNRFISDNEHTEGLPMVNLAIRDAAGTIAVINVRESDLLHALGVSA